MKLMTFAKLMAVPISLCGAGLYVLSNPSVVSPATLPVRAADLDNGRTMYNIGGCASCHATDAKKDPLSLGGGHQLKTQFGTFVVPNISMDMRFGIGAWSEAEFVTAMIKGVGRRGEHLYPAFPYTSYQRMRIDDVRDLFSYMQTLPTVETPSEPHKIGFPFNIRLTLGLWKILFLDGRTFEPDLQKSSVLNRGAYLVEGPGHCAECHSRRNLLGGVAADGRMAGGPNAEGKGFIPNMTQHPTDGLANWSIRDFELLLLSGGTPAGGFVADEMEDVVRNTAKLSNEDRRAMAEYLKTIPPRAGRRVAPPQ